jgi:hypothetical protein
MQRRPLDWMLNASLIALTFTVMAFAVNAPAQAQEKKPDAPAAGPAVKNPFDAIKHFSAVMNGGIINDENRKVYRSGKLMRTDFADQYRVSDIDIPVTWVIFTKPETKATCSKFRMADAGDFPFFGLKDFRVEQNPDETATDGKETVDGHPCKIESLRFVKSKNASPITIEMKLWEAEDLEGFPIKIEAHNLVTGRHFTISYSNVSLQPPDPKLFAHPAQCVEGTGKNVGTKETPASTKPSPNTTPKPAPTTPPQ